MLRTIVRCVTGRRFVDGWGTEYIFRRPQNARPGYCYIYEKGLIGRELKTQEELMSDFLLDEGMDIYAWNYE